MTTAQWNGQILAQSDECVEVEGNQYFPREALMETFFKPSDKTTFCPWKGEAKYLTVTVNGTDNVDAAWYYPEPKEAAKSIRGHVAFWKGVKVT